MEIDYIGSEKVAAIIEQSKFTKFIIIRIGASRQQAPIFECLQTATTQAAKDAFLQWARVTDNAVPYEIILTKDKAASTDESAKKELRFFFQLKKEPATKPSEDSTNIGTIIKQALAEQAAMYENNALRKEIEALRSEIRAKDEEEEEMEGNGGIDVNGLLSGLITSYLTKPQPTTAINGAEEEAAGRLQTAITRLHKADPLIIDDLEKLADIAGKNPSTFNMLLNSLRTM